MAENRGGRRQGRAGRSYSNRTDLNTQPVRTAPSTAYGEAAASARQQQAVPLPASPGVPPGIAGLMAPVTGTPPPAPGLFRESERPGEPITAGLGIGPGAGPGMDMALTTRDLLEAALRKFPTPELQRLLESIDE
jgi:hypothetical protein